MMTKTYELNGMSCNGCVSSVRHVLMQLPDVEEVKVQLHPPEAVITMSTSISIDKLQAQLNKAGHYTIKDA